MRNYVLMTTLSLVCGAGLGQTSQDSLEVLRKDFETDSLGRAGLRIKHCKHTVYWDANGDDWLIDGRTLIGKTKEQVLLILGKPNQVANDTIGKRRKKKLREFLFYDIYRTVYTGSRMDVEIIDGTVVATSQIIFN